MEEQQQQHTPATNYHQMSEFLWPISKARVFLIIPGMSILVESCELNYLPSLYLSHTITMEHVTEQTKGSSG